VFVAVSLGEPAERAVESAQQAARSLAPKAKWTSPEACHVTLAFLGYQVREKIPAFVEALRAVAARHGPLALCIEKAGAFGASKHPRVLWLGLAGDVEALAALQADVSAALTPLGYEPEQRPFAPHLTLARARDPKGDAGLARAAQRLQELPNVPAQVDALTLFKSDLSPKGARYTVVEQACLNGKPMKQR
jgi:2'-5' RNA ligase